MNNPNHSRESATGRIAMQPPECARPRAQQRSQVDERRNSPVLVPNRCLLRPGKGALRLLAGAMLMAGAGIALAEVHHVDVNSTTGYCMSEDLR
jgi:hypothetical protein